jgi:hypothetical protein
MAMPDRGDGKLMTDEELDNLLASANATLATRVTVSSDVNVLLTNLLDVRPERSLPEARPFMARVRLRQIIGDLYRAEVLANSIIDISPMSERLDGASKALGAAFTKASMDNLHEIADLASLLNVAVARALAVAMSSVPTGDMLLEGHLSALAGALIRALGSSLARANDLAMDLPDIPGADDEMMTRDLRGVDLSNHNIGPVQLLYGFIWDDETVWPTGLASEARNNSDSLGDGLSRIRGTTPFCGMSASSLQCRSGR